MKKQSNASTSENAVNAKLELKLSARRIDRGLPIEKKIDKKLPSCTRSTELDVTTLGNAKSTPSEEKRRPMLAQGRLELEVRALKRRPRPTEKSSSALLLLKELVENDLDPRALAFDLAKPAKLNRKNVEEPGKIIVRQVTRSNLLERPRRIIELL